MKFVRIEDEPKATQILWDLLVERAPYESISHDELPTYAEHQKYVRNHPYRLWVLIQDRGRYVGAISLSYRNEIGIGILESHRRRWLATRSLRKFMEETSPSPPIPGICPEGFVANINPLNSKSIRLFENLGFAHVQNTYQLSPR